MKVPKTRKREKWYFWSQMRSFLIPVTKYKTNLAKLWPTQYQTANYLKQGSAKLKNCPVHLKASIMDTVELIRLWKLDYVTRCQSEFFLVFFVFCHQHANAPHILKHDGRWSGTQGLETFKSCNKLSGK